MASDGADEDAPWSKEQMDITLDYHDQSRKRSSEVVLLETLTRVTRMELVLVAKWNSGAVVAPISPPPKQDPKRPKTTLPAETGNTGVKKAQGGKSNIDARSAASPAKDRRAQ